MFATIVKAAKDLASRAQTGDASAIGILGAAAVVATASIVFLLPKKEVLSADQEKIVSTKVEVDGKIVNVQRVTKADITTAAATLAAGNASDPLVSACGAESLTDASREKALNWLYNVLLKSSVPANEGALALRTESSDAVSIWYPNGGDVNFNTLLHNGAWQYLFRYSGWARRGRFFGSSEVIRRVRQRLVDYEQGREYYYLLTAAARPGNDQESSLAAVLKPVLALADAKGVACFAEATNPVLSKVLTNLGFVEVDSITLFQTSISNMRRAPVKSL